MPYFLRRILRYSCTILLTYIWWKVSPSGMFGLGFVIFLFGMIFVLPIGAIIDATINPYAKRGGLSDYEFEQYYRCAFRLYGYIARGQGRIDEKQIEKVTDLLNNLTNDPDRRKILISEFNEGKQDGFDPISTCLSITKNTHDNKELKHRLLEMLVSICYTDGELSENEYRRLVVVSENLSVEQSILERFIREAEAQVNFKRFYQYQQNSYRNNNQESEEQTYAQNSFEDELENAYNTLGVSKDTSFKEIKKAYLRLMKKYHPDRLASQGLSEEMIKIYTEKTQTIQQAYEVIKKHLGQ
ncbi:MAG: co-chaperone DjlA [Succinivibrionaceae bacterium]